MQHDIELAASKLGFNYNRSYMTYLLCIRLGKVTRNCVTLRNVPLAYNVT